MNEEKSRAEEVHDDMFRDIGDIQQLAAEVEEKTDKQVSVALSTLLYLFDMIVKTNQLLLECSKMLTPGQRGSIQWTQRISNLQEDLSKMASRFGIEL